MPNYILKELNKELTDGRKVVFPKMQTYSQHDFETVLKHMRTYAGNFSEGTMRAVIDGNGFMTLSDYAKATGQCRSAASNDLKRLVASPDSPIATRGSGSHKVWVRRACK